jgi:hypothetical protein
MERPKAVSEALAEFYAAALGAGGATAPTT